MESKDRDSERQEATFDRARSMAVESVWLQVNATHERLSELDPGDAALVSRAVRLLATLPEDDGSYSQDRFMAQQTKLMRMYWMRSHPSVVENYARVLLMGASIYGSGDSHHHLLKMCESDDRALAIKGIMQEYAERGTDPTAGIETYAVGSEERITAWLEFDRALPYGHDLKSVSARELDKIAEAIEVQRMSSLKVTSDDFLQDMAGELIRHMSPGAALKVATAFYNLPSYEHSSTYAVGMGVLSSPFLAPLLGDRAEAEERAAGRTERVDPFLALNFKVALMQQRYSVQEVVEFIDSQKITDARDRLFAGAVQRYLKHRQLDEARACLPFFHNPQLWANVVLDYSTFSFSSESVRLSDQDIRMLAGRRDPNEMYRNFLAPFIDGNYQFASAEFLQCVRFLARQDYLDTLETNAITTFLTRLAARAPDIGRRTYMESCRLLGRQQTPLRVTLDEVGVASGYAEAAERYAELLSTKYRYDMVVLGRANTLLQQLILRGRSKK